MELNPNCIRDILYTLEKSMIPDARGRTPSVLPREIAGIPPLDCYPIGVVIYHIQQMFSARLLDKGSTYVCETIAAITDISPLGHTLIRELREKNKFSEFSNLLLESGKTLSSIVAMLG